MAIAPDKLIIVEGIEGQVAGGQKLDRHWWGGNLEGVRQNPVRLSKANRLVYSPHEYGPGVFAQPWFSDPNMASILADRWEKGFGFIHTQNIAPLFIGEFGAKSVSKTTVEGRWINQFTDYLAATGISWTFWSWNPNSGDTGGVLTDDWNSVHTDKMALLTKLMGRKQEQHRHLLLHRGQHRCRPRRRLLRRRRPRFLTQTLALCAWWLTQNGRAAGVCTYRSPRPCQQR